jgi:epoxyqueuosine reductase QueG
MSQDDMIKENIIKAASDFIKNSEDNIISESIAISEKFAGMKIFETPIFGFGASDDALFEQFKDPSVIGSHYMLPAEWLPEARTVISFFYPFTEEIKKSNRMDNSWPSGEWLHGRIEGQAFINKACSFLSNVLINAGNKSVAPSLDERFFSRAEPVKDGSDHENISFSSNWSERHAAYVCGLGTFGLSKGLITEKGIAGRFGSIITDLYIAPEKRNYQGIYDYCSMCGACGDNCPADAISPDKGKDHLLCSLFLDKTAEKHKPRYGCGKCQTGVPCESSIP